MVTMALRICYVCDVAHPDYDLFFAASRLVILANPGKCFGMSALSGAIGRYQALSTRGRIPPFPPYP